MDTFTDIQSTIKATQAKMKKAVEHTLHEFNTLHTGKASPSMVEHLPVEAYGSHMKLNELAAITTPDSRTIMIQPWDKGTVTPIEKAIHAAKIGLNPVVDGNVLRCPIPELSKERRQDLVKTSHTMAEEGRVGVRAARREGMDLLKKANKDKLITEDELKRSEKEVQSATDAATKEISDHLAHKEQELMQL